MSRYFFHIRMTDGQLMRDDLGVELGNLEAARGEANLTAQSFEADRERGGFDYAGCRFEIVSADGRQTLNVPAFMKRLELV